MSDSNNDDEYLFHMVGCEAIACGTAIYVGDGVEINIKDFISYNCGQTLKTGNRVKVNLLDSTAITSSQVPFRKRWPW